MSILFIKLTFLQILHCGLQHLMWSWTSFFDRLRPSLFPLGVSLDVFPAVSELETVAPSKFSFLIRLPSGVMGLWSTKLGLDRRELSRFLFFNGCGVSDMEFSSLGTCTIWPVTVLMLFPFGISLCKLSFVFSSSLYCLQPSVSAGFSRRMLLSPLGWHCSTTGLFCFSDGMNHLQLPCSEDSCCVLQFIGLTFFILLTPGPPWNTSLLFLRVPLGSPFW